jgi:hypothetical protein
LRGRQDNRPTSLAVQLDELRAELPVDANTDPNGAYRPGQRKRVEVPREHPSPERSGEESRAEIRSTLRGRHL